MLPFCHTGVVFWPEDGELEKQVSPVIIKHSILARERYFGSRSRSAKEGQREQHSCSVIAEHGMCEDGHSRRDRWGSNICMLRALSGSPVVVPKALGAKANIEAVIVNNRYFNFYKVMKFCFLMF